MTRVGPSLIVALLECPQGPEIVRRVLERVAERRAVDTLAFTTYQLAAGSVARVDAQDGAGRAIGADPVSEAGLASIVAPAGSEGRQEGRG